MGDAQVMQDRVPLEEVRLGDWAFWERPHEWRDAAFATLRRESPVSFFPEMPFPHVASGKGFWALTRHSDVLHASRNPRLFSSYPSMAIQEGSAATADYFGTSMICLDDPEHGRLRRIVERSFRPKVVARAEESVRLRARRLVAQMVAEHPDGSADLVSALAGPLPLQVICDMVGVPEEDQTRVLAWTNAIMGEVPTRDGTVRAAREIHGFALALAEERRSTPADDLTTALVEAEVEGDRLSPAEIVGFFVTLLSGGNETTRNSICHGLYELTRRPDQRALWWSDFDAHARTAVEEIVRWATPVIYMRRRATEDIQLGDQEIRAEDKVVLWYASANRDEKVFADPFEFDLTRSPNPHVGFGAGGTHFCLGANLARREITVAFDELRRQVPDIHVTEPPDYVVNPFVNGIRTLQCAWTPTT
jgi:methyl-branched lipid omega-hydroxylase